MVNICRFSAPNSLHLLKNARSAFKAKLTEKYLEFEEQFASNCDSQDDTRTTGNTNDIISAQRANSASNQILSDAVVAAVFGQSTSTNLDNLSAVTKSYNNVDDELRSLFHAVNRNSRFGKWDSDPLDLYRDSKKNLQLSRALALDILSIPTGEAPSERIFSVASRVINFDRANLAASRVAETTFIKKNTRALEL